MFYERLGFEREMSDLGLTGPPSREFDQSQQVQLEDDQCQAALKTLAPKLSPPIKPGQPAELANARSVMMQIISYLRRVQPAAAADPDKWAKPPPWHSVYAPLLKDWFLICYGTPGSGSARNFARGKALQARLDAAFARTEPTLDLLKKHGGTAWQELLRPCFYDNLAELEQLAAETGPKMLRSTAPPSLIIPHKPALPVSYAEFMSHVTRPATSGPLQRGEGGTQFGSYKPGMAFALPGDRQRVVLWSGGDVVFFLDGAQIYAQRGPGFSDEVLLGSVIKGFENAAGAVMLAELMIDVGLSFTPWGQLWDAVSALRDISQGDWVGAAATLLPGGAQKAATSVRAVRQVPKGGALTKPLAREVASLRVKPGSSFHVGGGGFEIGGEGKWREGTWMVEQSAGKKKYRFFDEANQKLIEVDESIAQKYLQCSNCTYSARGKKGVLYTKVDREMAKIARRPRFRSPNNRPMIRRQVVQDLVLAYGSDARHVVDDILSTWESAVDGARHAEDTMIVATQLSKIKGIYGYQDAADIFGDLAINSVTTMRGAMFELEWAAKHVDEVEAMGVPIFKKNWKVAGKGLDVLKKNMEAVELKNFDFTKSIYSAHPARAAASIKRQAISRLRWKKPQIKAMTFIFDSRAGPMPAAFKAELDKIQKSLAKKYKQPVRFEFWPR